MKKLLIIFAILCLAAPAMAADWEFYGSSRMATYWTTNDLLRAGVKADDSDLTWTQQGNSRIGANVMFNDQIGGRFEAGIASTGWTKRIMYGTYNFGNSELLFGQTYTPTSDYFYSNQVYGTDNDLFGTGQFYAGRNPMVRWKWGGLKVALVTPSTAGNAIVTGVTDTDVTLPKLEASYKFKTDIFFLDVFGGYNTYQLDGAAKEYDVDSYVAGLGGGLTMGPLYFNAGVHMGQNLGNYGGSGYLAPDNATAADTAAIAAAASASYDAVGDKIIDNDALGYLAVLGFNFNEMFSVEAGYGYTEYEPDVTPSVDSNATSYYLNAVITIAPGFFIVPEIGKVEYEAADVDLGDFTYYGAKWQINF